MRGYQMRWIAVPCRTVQRSAAPAEESPTTLCHSDRWIAYAVAATRLYHHGDGMDRGWTGEGHEIGGAYMMETNAVNLRLQPNPRNPIARRTYFGTRRRRTSAVSATGGCRAQCDVSPRMDTPGRRPVQMVAGSVAVAGHAKTACPGTLIRTPRRPSWQCLGCERFRIRILHRSPGD